MLHSSTFLGNNDIRNSAESRKSRRDAEERFPVIMAIMLMMIVEQFRESRNKNQKYKVTCEVLRRVISRVFQFSGTIRVSKYLQECSTFEFIIGMRICAEERSAVVLV